MQLERELSATNSKYNSAANEWKETFQRLEKSHKKETQEARELLSRKEAEAAAELEAAICETKSRASALESTLKDREAEHKRVVENLRTASEQKEKSLNEKIERLANDLQQYKLTANKDFALEKEAATKKQSELQVEIEKTRQELVEQKQLTETYRQKAEKMKEKNIGLEKQADNMNISHASEIAQWKDRCKEIEQARIRDQQAARDEKARIEAESRRKLDEANKEVQGTKAELRSYLESISVQESELESEMKRMSALLETLQSSIEKVRTISLEAPPSPALLP